MALDTYNGLISEAPHWLFDRDDLTSQWANFIRMFEAKMNRTLFCRQMEQRSTTPVNLSSAEPEFISLPSDFQTMRRLRITSATGKPNIKYATPAQLDSMREKDDTAGTPQFFTIFGTEIELYPTPNEAFTLELIYRKNIAALSVANQSNWLLQLAPDLYLYGALLEAAPYLHEDERIPVWANAVAGGVQQINALSEQATYGAGPLVIRRNRGGYS